MQELIQKLTGELGISEGQAKGGAGLVFEMAKSKLDGADFGQLKDALGGGVEELISAAPSTETGGGMLGAVSGKLGGLAGAIGGGGLGKMAELASGFGKLDLDAGMVGKVVGVITEFVKNKGGDSALAILKKVL